MEHLICNIGWIAWSDPKSPQVKSVRPQVSYPHRQTSVTMNIKKYFDYIALFFLFASVGSLSVIQIRKTIKHGTLNSLTQELDNFDKKLIKISLCLLVIFIILHIMFS